MENTHKPIDSYLSLLPYKLMVKARDSVNDPSKTYPSFEAFIKDIMSTNHENDKLWFTVMNMYELGILSEIVSTESKLIEKYNEVIGNTMERLSTAEVN
jgi:hypothetical protein